MKWQGCSCSLCPEVSLRWVNIPGVLNGQQWKIVLSLPLNAVTTQTTTTQTSACDLNVLPGRTFLAVHALHCVASQTSFFTPHA